jgi:predicted PurR-regulated permease PerM
MVHYPIASKEGSSMVRAIEKVLTLFIVIVLIILLLNSLGPFIANSIQPASERLSDILHNTWIGVQHIAHTGTDSYHTTR